MNIFFSRAGAHCPLPASGPRQRGHLADAAPAALSGLLLGAGVFVLFWGTVGLNPKNFQWMIDPFSGDFTFSSLAALAFQREAWSVPPGVINTLVYPAQTSITFSDGVPIVALLSKVVAKSIGHDFQYAGIWGLGCVMLQGMFGSLIFFRHSGRTLVSLIAACFVIFSPFLLGRMFGHVSMAGQWVILFPIFLLTYHDEPAIRRRQTLLWVLALTASVGVLAYFTPMVLSLCLIHYWLRARADGMIEATRRFISMSAIGLSCCATMFWLGGGVMSGMVSGGAEYGAVPFNLAGFFNPGPYSQLIPPIASGPTELYYQESYAWLGLGIWAAIVLLTIRAIGRGSLFNGAHWYAAAPYLVVSLAVVAFSATNVLRFGPSVVYSYPLPDSIHQIFSSFRSSARIVWPVWYLIVIFTLAAVMRLSARRSVSTLLVASLLAIQVWDGREWQKPLQRTDDYSNASPTLPSPFWRELHKAGKNLYVLPNWGSLRHEQLGSLYWNTINQDITTNFYWLGRYPMDEINRTIDEKINEFRAGRYRADDILLINHVPFLAGVNIPSDRQLYLVDGITLLARKGMPPSTGMQTATLEDISLPRYLSRLQRMASPGGDKVIVVGGRGGKPALPLDQASRTVLRALGLDLLDQTPDDFAYIAVLSDGKVVTQERRSGLVVGHIEGVVPGDIDYLLTPGEGEQRLDVGGVGVIGSVFGLNIAVYDSKTSRLVERAAFGTYSASPGVLMHLE